MVVLDDEQHMEPTEKDGAGVKEASRCDRLGLRGQELLPSGGCALGCSVEPDDRN
jgi:hypothetical protein